MRSLSLSLLPAPFQANIPLGEIIRNASPEFNAVAVTDSYCIARAEVPKGAWTLNKAPSDLKPEIASWTGFLFP